MTTTSPVNGFSIPEQTDGPPDIETALHPFANEVDTRLVPIFTTLNARDAAIAAPVEGQLAYVQEVGEPYWYTGAAARWTSMVGRWRRQTANMTLNDGSFDAVPGLSWTVEANTIYLIEGRVNYVSNTADDIAFQWDVPSGTVGFWRIDSSSSTGISVTAVNAVPASGATVIEPVMGYFTTSVNPGVATIMACKNLDTSTDGTLFANGTAIQLRKI